MVDILLYMRGSDALPVDVPKWVGMPMKWVGADGSEWELTNRDRGVYLRPGVRGLGMPTYERYSSRAALVPGSRHKGSNAQDREVYWPVKVWRNTGSTEFMEFDRAFWDSFDPDEEGQWVVTHPDGATRSLPCRFVEAEDTLEFNPVHRGWVEYRIRLLADSVYWQGETKSNSFTPPDPRNVHPTAEEIAQYGYPADTVEYYSPGGSLDTASFENPGDVPLYPVWTAIGPITNVSFGPTNGSIIVPFPIPPGHAVKIDTNPADPASRVLWYGAWNPDTMRIIDPVNRTGDLDPATRFMPILKGESLKLNISMGSDSKGTVIVEGTPQYRRAW